MNNIIKINSKIRRVQIEDFNEEGDLCEFCGRYGMIGDINDKNYSCYYCGLKRESEEMR